MTYKTFDDLVFEEYYSMKGLSAKMNFDNGYGVSVVRFKLSDDWYGSYTSNENEWELAVLYNDKLCYDTPITDDVMGHLLKEDVTRIMKEVQDLIRRRASNE